MIVSTAIQITKKITIYKTLLFPSMNSLLDLGQEQMWCGTGHLQYLMTQAFGSIPGYLFPCPWLSASGFRLVPLLSVFVEKSLRKLWNRNPTKSGRYFQSGRKTLGNGYLLPSIRFGTEKPCLLYWKKTKKWRLELWYYGYKVTHMKTKNTF